MNSVSINRNIQRRYHGKRNESLVCKGLKPRLPNCAVSLMGVTKKRDRVTARSEATKQSLQNAPIMRDCFARRRLAMTSDFFLVNPLFSWLFSTPAGILQFSCWAPSGQAVSRLPIAVERAKCELRDLLCYLGAFDNANNTVSVLWSGGIESRIVVESLVSKSETGE